MESFNELGNSRLTNIEKQSLEDVFLSSNTMVEGISRLSGVNLISSGLGIQKVVVRGLSGMRVVSYVNGMQINNQQWANDHGIGFTDLGLAEVELIKGSSSIKVWIKLLVDFYILRILLLIQVRQRVHLNKI